MSVDIAALDQLLPVGVLLGVKCQQNGLVTEI
jgi:hypothetical protein